MPEVEDRTEVEWQFDVDDLDSVEHWIRNLPASVSIAITAAEPVEHLDTYFDTSDWRVYRSGYALRLRRSQGWDELTLKAVDSKPKNYARRREVTQELAGFGMDTIDQIDGTVGDRVRAVRGRNATSPLFTALTQRKRFRLWCEGQEIGELALDNTKFIGESFKDQSPMMRVEIESTSEQTDQLQSFVDVTADACNLRPATASKFRIGVSILGLHPPEFANLGLVKFDRDSSIAELAMAVLRRHFIEFLRHEPGTRLGDDVEELHDMRVAARRLRAALALFSTYLPSELESIREDLRWVASALGEVRDFDVQLAEIEGWKGRLDPPDSQALDPLIVELNRGRGEARERMLNMLDSERYEGFVAELTGCLTGGIESDQSELAVAAVPDIIQRRYRKFRRRADRLRASSANDAYHRVRIDGKRLRYALEFVSPLYGKIVRDFIEQLVAVQDLLGRHQDSIVAIDHLRDIASGSSASLPPPTVFAMGRVAEGYAAAAIDSRDRFPKTYKRLTGKRWKRVQRELGNHSRRRLSKFDEPVENPKVEPGVG